MYLCNVYYVLLFYFIPVEDKMAEKIPYIYIKGSNRDSVSRRPENHCIVVVTSKQASTNRPTLFFLKIYIFCYSDYYISRMLWISSCTMLNAFPTPIIYVLMDDLSLRFTALI